MEYNADILVIGGGPAGIVAAMTARRYYSGKKVVLMREIAEAVIPCGIPYMLASLEKPEHNAMGTAPLEKSGVRVVIEKAEDINRKQKSVVTASGDRYCYQKLIVATGSHPIVPPVPGIDKEGVYPIYKEMRSMRTLVDQVRKAKRVLIIGGGFIGVEFADEISKLKGVEVSLVEILPHILSHSFDQEFCLMAEDRLASRGVKLITGTTVKELVGERRVEGARLADGREIGCDCVIPGVGYEPSIELALRAELDLGRGRGIWVDEYMRTVDRDIFAVGDCAGKRDFFTRRDIPVMLASTATAEARIAGANLYQLKVVRENKGTIAVFSTCVGDLVLGSAGLTEQTADVEGFEIITGDMEGVDRHPGAMPGVHPVKVKLIFSRQSGIIMGGQVAGGSSAGEMINIIGVAIQKRISITELETLQMATHPWLTSAPTMYPLVVAAQNAVGKI